MVTAENWIEKAKAFTLGGDLPVVRREQNAMAFWAWIAFWNRIGQRTRFIETLESITVPATFPWNFSADADCLRDEDLVPQRAVNDAPIGSERRRQLSSILRGQMPRDMGRASRAPRRPRDTRMQSRFDEAGEPFPADAPIAVSPALAPMLEKPRRA